MTTIRIGVPTLNGPDRLQRLVESVEHCTDFDRYPETRLLVCDDASTPSNLLGVKHVVDGSPLRGQGRIDLIMHQERLGIARSWNHLTAHEGPRDITVLINDDIEVVDHWLDVVVFSLQNNSKLGMLGLNNYVGITKGQHRAASSHWPGHVAVPRVDYHEARLMTGGGRLLSSTGPIFAFRRDAFEAAGGFDERYFVYYEELHFGCALRQKGYFHAMASYPLVYHMGGATNSEPRNLDAKKVMAESREKFLSHWGKSIAQLSDELPVATEALASIREWNTLIGNWR